MNPTNDIKAAFANWDATFNKGDMKGLGALYANDGKVFPGGTTPSNGPAEIEKLFAGVRESGFHDHKLVLLDCGGTEGMFWASAEWSGKGKPGPDGQKPAFNGLAFVVFARQANGELKVRFHGFK